MHTRDKDSKDIGTVQYQSWMNTKKEGKQFPAFKFAQKTSLLITYTGFLQLNPS